MLREIIKTSSEEYIIHIPKEYLNREIEILILPFTANVREEFSDNDIYDKIKRTSGILKGRIIDPVQWQKDVRSEWDK